MATDPQVPGPGLRRPAPKNVATRSAQIGALAVRSGLGGADALAKLVFVLWSALRNSLVGFRFDGRNYVRAAGPLAKVDRPATIAAKWKLGVGSCDKLLANRTTELDGAFSRHKGCRNGTSRGEGKSLQDPHRFHFCIRTSNFCLRFRLSQQPGRNRAQL